MKKLIAIILTAAMLCCFAGCKNYKTFNIQHTEKAIGEMGFIIVEQIYVKGDNSAYIVYDPVTKVEYLIYDGYRSFSISPYYDENGNVAFYGD